MHVCSEGYKATWNTELRVSAKVREIPGDEQLVMMMPQVPLPFQRGKELKDCYQLLLLGQADKVFLQCVFSVLPWIWQECKNQAKHLSQNFYCNCESQHIPFITGWENIHCWFLIQKLPSVRALAGINCCGTSEPGCISICTQHKSDELAQVKDSGMQRAYWVFLSKASFFTLWFTTFCCSSSASSQDCCKLPA